MQQNSATEITLKKAELDFHSRKTQGTFCVIFIVLASLALFWNSLNVGFLHDDLLHLSYVSKAIEGDWKPFLNNFTGNWADSDLMKSYRPITSVSLLIDVFLWQTNAFGFHLTNILLLSACAVLVSFITLELTGMSGNRLGTAAPVWAGLLFVAYPLHLEAAVWIIGRVDLVCTFFYLLSVFGYLRFRLLKERNYLWLSLSAFLLSLLSKEMAATLPAVITAAEVLLFTHWKGSLKETKLDNSKELLQRLLYVTFFWALFCCVMGIRTLILGTMIGGYGEITAGQMVRNIFDKATALKILFPINEEVSVLSWLRPTLTVAYCAAIGSLLGRIFLRSVKPAPLLFVVLWAAIAITPSFQVWHIYPNLVGSRLFFLSSAPFCIALAFLLLPAIDTLKRRFVAGATIFGTIVLGIIFMCWSLMLTANLQPWLAAGDQMRRLHSQAVDWLERAGGKKVLFVDLPTDYSGAPMLTRQSYLEMLLSPPLSKKDYRAQVESIEPPLLGAREFIWPEQFESTLNSDAVAAAIRWDKASASFVPMSTTSGNDHYSIDLQKEEGADLVVEPATVKLEASDKWRVAQEQAVCITQFPNYVRICGGREPVAIFFPNVSLDPRKANLALIDATYTAKSGCHNCEVGMVSVVWEAEFEGQDKSVQIRKGKALLKGSPSTYPVWLGRYRDWTLAKRITKLGVSCSPGEYYFDVRAVKVVSDDVAVPKVALKDRSVQFDAGDVDGAAAAKLLVTKPGTTFDAMQEIEITTVDPPHGETVYLHTQDVNTVSGVVVLPDSLYNSPGLHQIRVVATRPDGTFIGLPSEPLSVTVKRQK